jgi:serine/threonine protein kinase
MLSLSISDQQLLLQFFEQVPLTASIPSECDGNKKILSSDGTCYYVMKKPKSFGTLPQTRTLEQVLGVYSGGPGGRRLGEANHNVENYLEFVDLIRKLLIYDPAMRWSATAALEHPFFAQVLDMQPTAASSGAGSPRHPTSSVGHPNDEVDRRPRDPTAQNAVAGAPMTSSPVNEALSRSQPAGVSGAMVDETSLSGKRRGITPSQDSPRIR